MPEVDYKLRLLDRPAPLVLAFAGMGGKFQFQGVLEDMPYHCIFLRDPHLCWYHKGMRGLGKDVDSSVKGLERLIKDIQKTGLYTMGPSAGGYAAILFGSLLKADAILSFSPQVFLNRANRMRYKDNSRAGHIRKLPPNGKYHDLARLNTPPLYFIYGKQDATDILHARHMRAKITELIVRDAGHHAVKGMRDDGSLEVLFKRVIR